ncbi:hypothetical protein CVD28_18280, partial [Bacillus sp. M6-12]|uniref:cell envelope integrity protein TolA n=1 Tax=Bacillus sp. M6-12 TaxID=2054166 RepID=UPI000CC73EB5
EARLRVEKEAQARTEEEARLRVIAEARARTEEEARIKAEEEAQARAQEARLRAEAEEEARIKAETEAMAREEEEALIKVELEASVKQDEGSVKNESNKNALKESFLARLTSAASTNEEKTASKGSDQGIVLSTSGAQGKVISDKVPMKKQKKMSEMTKGEMIEYLAKFPPIVPKPYCEFRINGKVIRGQLEKKTGEMVFIKQGYGKRPIKCDIRQIETVAILNL